MDLVHLAARVCVTHRPSIAKAKEYQRLAHIKRQQGQHSNASPEAQSVCCIELGCRFYDASFDSALCLKYSLCKTTQAYAKVLASLQHDLGLHTVVSTKELCLQHGCPQASEMAKRVLHTYKQAMSADRTVSATNDAAAVDAASSSSSSSAAAAAAAASPSPSPIAVSLPSIPAALLSSRSVYPCVAFYLSCKLLRIASVDKKRLLQTAQCTEKEFVAVSESFRSVMPELRPKDKEPASAASSPDKRKRKKKSADEDDAAPGLTTHPDGFVPADGDADFDPGLDLCGDLLGAVAAECAAPARPSSADDAETHDERKEHTAAKKQRMHGNSEHTAVDATDTTPAAPAAAAAAAVTAASTSPSPRNKASRSGPVVFSSPAPFVVPASAASLTLAAAPAARATRAKKLELS